MDIPFVIIAGAYFLLFLVWVTLTLINVYHVLRFAYWTKMPLLVTGFYLLFAIAVVACTGYFLRDVDWTAAIHLNVSAPSIDIKSFTPSVNSFK
jgi:hypothetical protein